MNKVNKYLKKGLAWGSLIILGGSITGGAYLWHINSIIGPINIEKDNAISYYMNDLKMTKNKAYQTYYWVIFNIAIARITTFGTYQKICEKLNKKIFVYSIENY
jgi:hypothetical protein